MTAAASVDAVAEGSEWTYLGVFNETDLARRAYEGVGFTQVGDACPDLLLIG